MEGVVDPGTKQRLAAILAADAVGYSRLMSADPTATVAALDFARSIFRKQTESHQGRVIDMAGDSILAVFETAAGAVSASLAIQGELEAAAKGVADAERMQFRFGVHLGDLLEKPDGTVYGEGINIAARLQALAEPGGITVSDSVRNAVRGRVNAEFDDQGHRRMKNIAEPIRMFRLVAMDSPPMAKARAIDDADISPEAGSKGMKVLIVDDHALIRDGLFQLLPRLQPGIKTVGAATCEEALVILSAQKDVGLILMDLGLPGLSGNEAIRSVRDSFPEIPIVALSGTQDRDAVLSAIKSGAMGFIPKTYTWERMSGALQFILLHKGIFLPAELMLGSAEPAGRISKTDRTKRVDPRSLGLTDRQVTVLQHVLLGKPNKAIARDLGIELATVRTHVTAVLRSLNVTTRTEAVIKAHQLGLVFEAIR